MATIPREYDDSDILTRLKEAKPNLNFGGGQVDEIEVLSYGSGFRTVRLTLDLDLTEEEFMQVFDNPIG